MTLKQKVAEFFRSARSTNTSQEPNNDGRVRRSRRDFFKVTGTVGLAAALGLAGTARARERNETSKTDLSRLNPVEQTELLQLERSSRPYQEKDIDNRRLLLTAITIPLEEGGAFTGGSSICKVRGCNSTVAPAADQIAGFAMNGKSLGGVEITEFTRLFRETTGVELYGLRWIGETGVDPKAGRWVNVYGIGMDKDGRLYLQKGMPVVAASYAYGKFGAEYERIV